MFRCSTDSIIKALAALFIEGFWTSMPIYDSEKVLEGDISKKYCVILSNIPDMFYIITLSPRRVLPGGGGAGDQPGRRVQAGPRRLPLHRQQRGAASCQPQDQPRGGSDLCPHISHHILPQVVFPPSLALDQDTAVARPGANLRLGCSVEAVPEPVMSWATNNRAITKGRTKVF